MATKNYTTKTSALKATIADIRNLEAKKIKVNGKDIILDAKHAGDTRETITENDLWGQYTEIKDGQVIVHDDWVTNPNKDNGGEGEPISLKAWNTSITKVDDNKAYVGDSLYANIQTDKIKDGAYMFATCENFTSFTSDLSSLTNGCYMFEFCPKFISFDANLGSLTNGEFMFTVCSNLTTFTSDLSSLTYSIGMFAFCENLTTFTSDLSSLTDGIFMFQNCSNLTTFTSDLSSLTNSTCMFQNCSNLTTFTSDLSSLTNSTCMFQDCLNLSTFTSDLSSLTHSNRMFRNCKNLTTFTYDLCSLINGEDMFSYCSNLTTFTSDLSSLINGFDMFLATRLTPQSVMYIIDSIMDIKAEKKLYEDGIIPYVTKDNETNKYSAPKGFMSDGTYVYTYNGSYDYALGDFLPLDSELITVTIPASYVGKLDISIRNLNYSSGLREQLETFAKEATFDSWENLKQAFKDKGWSTTFSYSTVSSSNTYDMRGDRAISHPIYAQLIEVENKDRAEYTNEDGSKFYNIRWGNDVTDYDAFQQFDSLEDAAAHFNIKPIERN